MQPVVADPGVVKKIDWRVRHEPEHTISASFWLSYDKQIEQASQLQKPDINALAGDYEHLADCELAMRPDHSQLAIHNLRAALAIRLKHWGPNAFETKRVAQKLMALYRHNGTPDDAKRVQGRLQSH